MRSVGTRNQTSSFPRSAWERLIHRSAVIQEDAERPKNRSHAERGNEKPDILVPTLRVGTSDSPLCGDSRGRGASEEPFPRGAWERETRHPRSHAPRGNV